MKSAQTGAVMAPDGVGILPLPERPSRSLRRMSFGQSVSSVFQMDPKVSVGYDLFRWVTVGILFVGVVWIPLLEVAWRLFQALTN